MSLLLHAAKLNFVLSNYQSKTELLITLAWYGKIVTFLYPLFMQTACIMFKSQGDRVVNCDRNNISSLIVIDKASVQNLLVPCCCVLGKTF